MLQGTSAYNSPTFCWRPFSVVETVRSPMDVELIFDLKMCGSLRRVSHGYKVGTTKNEIRADNPKTSGKTRSSDVRRIPKARSPKPNG
jgi:hypothetical protein